MNTAGIVLSVLLFVLVGSGTAMAQNTMPGNRGATMEMLPITSMADSAQVEEMLRLIEFLPKRYASYSDLPTRRPGYGCPPCCCSMQTDGDLNYAEQIALLERALRIARELQAKEVPKVQRP
jgi:hypothetical protein